MLHKQTNKQTKRKEKIDEPPEVHACPRTHGGYVWNIDQTRKQNKQQHIKLSEYCRNIIENEDVELIIMYLLTLCLNMTTMFNYTISINPHD